VTLNDVLNATGPHDGCGGAQTSGLGSFLNIFANINVQDALNNTLNSNNVNLSLTDVLNGNNIATGQVVGVFVNSGGVITTIV
jgi:hypothetical protein